MHLRADAAQALTEFRGTVLLEVSSEVEATDDEAYRAAIGWLEDVRAKNATKLDELTRWYAAAAIALGLEVDLHPGFVLTASDCSP